MMEITLRVRMWVSVHSTAGGIFNEWQKENESSYI